MKTKFTSTELSLIRKWAEDAAITPYYITMYPYTKHNTYGYRIMISDSEKYSTMDFLNPEGLLFDTISLVRQISKLFEHSHKIFIQ